jgi:hypothetical protein
VTNAGSNRVSVLLNNGTGGFSAAAPYPAGGTGTWAIVVADFNRDGNTDLVVANAESDTVGILLGNGAGGFAAVVTYASGGQDATDLAVGDFNGDGNTDVAITNHASGNVGVLLGNGTGVISPVTTYPMADVTHHVTAADFNGDGKDDLAVTNWFNNQVRILLANDTGFVAAGTYPIGGTGPSCVRTGDFNGDGKADLVLAIENNKVAVLRGDGAGAFAPAEVYGSTGAGFRMTVADFNADGRADLAVNNPANNTVGVLLNANGPLTLLSPHGFPLDVQFGGFMAGQLVQGPSNAFDGLNRLQVGGSDYAPALTAPVRDDGGRTVVTGTQTVAGLQVHREITVPGTGNEDFARTVDVFTNPTGSPIAASVRIVGNLGSDSATTVFQTSDGDTDIEPSDQWIGTDDAAGAGSPAIIHYVHGPYGLQPETVVRTGDNIEWTYNLTVPAGQTVRLAQFTILAQDRTAGIAAAQSLVRGNGFRGEAAAFLTQEEQDSLANFGFDTTLPMLDSFVRKTPATSPTDADTLVFLATFSEAVAGVSVEDFEVQGATTASVTGVTPVTASTYDVTVSGGDLVDFLGTVGLNVASGQNILDLAGNALAMVEPAVDETYTVTNGDVTVSIPDDLLGAPGVSVTVPVRFVVNNLAGVTISGFDIVIEFDATKFSVGSAQVGALLAANSDLSGEWSVPAAGKLIFSADATEGSELFAYGTQGDLFTIVFDVVGDAPAGDWPLNLLAAFGDTPTAVFANDYADLRLLPGPTNASDDRVDGRMTIDATPPTLAVNIVDVSLSDEDNNSSVTFTFSEAVTGFTADDVTVAGGTLSDFAGSGSSYTATFTATDGVDATGSVSVAAGRYTDVAGNSGGEGADTVAIDTLNPTLAVVSPVGLGAPRDTHLVVTLDEAIRKGTGTIVVRNSDDGSAVQTIDVSSPAVTVDGPRATIDLAGLLAGSANFYVEVAAGAFEDLAGNDFAGISGPTAWSFNTNFIVTGLTATSTGFRVQFSQDLDVSQLNLYDQGGLLGPADVTLIGAVVGKVRGSFVIGPGSREATFIKTSGLLPPDQYTVTLTSAATAFRDAGGSLLDGDGNGTPGGDFVHVFNVSAPDANAITVSLPNVTRGYGQPVNLPANVLTAGLPVQLSEGLGLSGLDLELRYNPSLLSITGFTLDSGVTARGGAAQLTFPSAGVARLTVDTTGSLGATSGLLTLGSFTAAVPGDALYGAKHILDISNLRVYDNGPSLLEVPSIDDDAIHVAAYFGDTNGSGFYNSPDSGLVRRIIGQLNTGLAAYALADPMLIADITLNGVIQSNDTTSIRRAIGGILVPNIPALRPDLDMPGIAGADPKLTIPRNLAAAPGTTLTVPVVIEVTEPAGVTIGGFDIGIEFDADKFTVSQAKLGDLFQGTDLVGVMTQPSPGRLVFSADSLVGTTRFPFGTVGHLVTLTVTVAADAAPGPAAFNLLATLGLGRTGVFDANLQQLVLNPAPTNAADDPVDGVVMIGGPNQVWHNGANPLDANGDGLVTALDALVVINSLNAALDAPAFPNVTAIPAVWCDVNNDQVCTALDVLLLVNHLNTQASSAGEGEPSWAPETPAAAESSQDSPFADLESELSPFEDVLSELADDVASAWRSSLTPYHERAMRAS